LIKRSLPVVIGLLLFVLILKNVNLEETWDLVKSSDWRLLFLALLAFLAMVYIKGIRWSYLLKMQGASYSIWNCFLIYMGTLYLGNLTPGRAGDFAKVFYLKQDLKFSTGTSMASVLVDRVFDLYLLLILGCAGVLAYSGSIDATLVKAVWVFFALLVVITLLAFNKKIGGVLLKAVFQRMLKQTHKEKTDKLFEDFHKGMTVYYRPSILVPILLSLVSYVFFFWGCYLIAQAMSLSISIFYLTFCVSVVNIVSLVTFLGMGTREGAFFILFPLVALTKSQAIAYSLLIFFVGNLLFSLIGLLCFLMKPIQLKSFFNKQSET
jgi:glycosyltransferase 2 family protein